MKTTMAAITHEDSSSFSFSRRYFNWKKKPDQDHLHYNEDEYNSFESSSNTNKSNGHQPLDLDLVLEFKSCGVTTMVPKKKKLSVNSKFRSLFTKSRLRNDSSTLGSKVVGTLFGSRRGHVSIAFQENPNSTPAFLIELSTPTSVLVREMASGLVRVALECDKNKVGDKKGIVKLIEEPLWRAYCNGKKCGYAMRRDCGPHEWRVLRSVGPITMGAGVLPCGGGVGDGGGGGGGVDGELMYMRAKFERIVGSKDSEAFYMMNPDGSGVPELSVYLLRV